MGSTRRFRPFSRRRCGGSRVALTTSVTGATLRAVPVKGHSTPGVNIMAQRTVQVIIGQILTDEEFRSEFLERPTETLRSLRDRGLELTNVEVEALGQTDRRLWTFGAEWVDGRLQRCRLSGGEQK